MRMPAPFRIEPRLPTQAMKTYQVVAPRAPEEDFWRPASCAEVDCPPHLHGWKTILPAGREDLLHAARTSGRRHTETRLDGGLVEFVFEAGQPCFQAHAHRARTARPELYVVRGGDWRGNPHGTERLHTRPEDWVDDFATHQDQLAARVEHG